MSVFKDFVDSIFQFDKIPNKIFFAGIVFGMLYIYEPFSWILYELPVDWKPYIGIIFYISSVMFIVNLSIWIVKKITDQFKIRKFKENHKKIYRSLDPFEMNVIREFYLLKRNTLALPYFDPIIQGLADKFVIVPATTLSGGRHIINGMQSSYRLNKYITPIVRMEDFDFPKNNTEREIYRIQQTRPNWINERFYLS